MAAYCIVDVNVTDPALFEEYRKLVPASLEKHGGRFLVRGGQTSVREGDWQPKRMVVLEFPDMAAARAWYDGEAYRVAKAMRFEAATANFVMVEGV